MTTKTILLIHKEPNIRELVKACLTDLGGWNVRVASSTLEGLEQARISQPGAIVLEAPIWEIDGLQFLKQLRSQPATQAIPIVLLTLKGKWVDLQPSWFHKYQVVTVILNPLDPAMLCAQIGNELNWDLSSEIDTGT